MTINDMPIPIDQNPTIRVDAPHRGATIAAQVFTGEDGSTVVQLDTTEGLGRLRINVNDTGVYDADPDATNPPGSIPSLTLDYGDSTAATWFLTDRVTEAETILTEHFGAASSVQC